MLGRLSSEPFLDMASYSFDVVSDFDRQELVNALDQVRRDVGQRYDLKDSNTEIELTESEVLITTASDMTLQAVEDVLRAKATKRNLSLKIFDFQMPEAVGGSRVKQVVKLRKGLSQEIAKKLSKSVRDSPTQGSFRSVDRGNRWRHRTFQGCHVNIGRPGGLGRWRTSPGFAARTGAKQRQKRKDHD